MTRRLVGWATALMMVVLTVLSCTFSIQPVAGSSCAPATTFVNGDQINVALLVWLIDQPTGLYTGNVADTTPTLIPGYGFSLVQSYQLSIDFYVSEMRKRGNILPLPNGQSVKVNFVYINMAGANGTATYADYSNVYAANNIPKFLIATTYYMFPTSIFFDTTAYGGGPSLVSRIISNDTTVLKQYFNITQPFTFIVPPALFLDLPTQTLANTVEDAQSQIIVHPFASARETFICDGTINTYDCVDTKYNRSRRGGARRFQTLFSTLFDSTANQYAALDSFHTLGVKSIILITDYAISFSYWAGLSTIAGAEQLNIAVLKHYTMEVAVNCDPTQTVGNITAPNCPPPQFASLSSVVFSEGKTADDVAAELKNYNADALIFLGSPQTAAGWTWGQLFTSMKKVQYTPKAISWGGITESWIEYFMDTPDDMQQTWSTLPWDARLKGPIYHNVASDTSFELLPANATHDGPAVFADAFDAKYGPASKSGPGGVGAHPMYDVAWKSTCIPAIGWGTMMIIQKMIEASMTLDVPTILNSAKSIATPGVYHQIQFDQYGRTARVNEMLIQKTSTGASLLIAPYNIGSNPVFPLPTWAEREFSPVFYSEVAEKVMIAINTVCIVLCIMLLVIVTINYKTPVIRAATPSFCFITIFGGIMMLISNYFNTLVVNDAHCAASVWFLTLGFTLMFASTFIKTFRIWRIFGQAKLQVVKVADSQLLIAVGVFLLIDIIINAAWMGGAGMNSIEITVDPVRPYYNYLTCDFNKGQGAIFTHLAIKGAILLFGVGLTWAVRNVSTAFNESTLIGFSIYNVSFVICFIVPIIAVGLGGRNTVYLIRAFAIMFVVLTTVGLLYIPKLLTLSSSNLVTRTGTGTGLLHGPKITDTAGNAGTRVLASSNKSSGGEAQVELAVESSRVVDTRNPAHGTLAKKPINANESNPPARAGTPIKRVQPSESPNPMSNLNSNQAVGGESAYPSAVPVTASVYAAPNADGETNGAETNDEFRDAPILNQPMDD